jgi:hypothetical protein
MLRCVFCNRMLRTARTVGLVVTTELALIQVFIPLLAVEVFHKVIKNHRFIAGHHRYKNQ